MLRFDPKARLLIVGTVRPEEVDNDHPLHLLLAQLQREEQIIEVTLGPLNAAEIKTLAAQTAGHELDSTALAKIVQFTEGNPLFIVETTRLENGAWATETLAARAEVPSRERRALPPKILAVIQHRLRQLSPVAREIASLAAASGRSFTFSVLAPASGLDEEGLARALDELWQRRIIREQGANAYDFSHDRIRETAYLAISPIRRRLLHSRLAEAFRRLHSEDLDAISATLAHHYEQGGLTQKAVDWYQRAATVADHRYAYASAIEYVDAALRLLLSLAPTPERLTQQLALLIDKGNYLMPVYGLVSAEHFRVYQQVAQIIDQVSDVRLRVIARSRLRGFYGVSGRVQEAYVHAEQLLALAQQLQEPSLQVEAYKGNGMVNLQLGRFPLARRYFEQKEGLLALSFSKANRTEYDLMKFADQSDALTLWFLGYPGQARRKIAAALSQAEIIGDPAELSVVLFFADILYRHMGEVELLSSVLEKLRELDTQYAIWTTRLECLSLQGWLAVQQGDFAQSMEQMRAEIDAFKAAGHAMFQTHRLGMLAEAQLKAGRFVEAWATLEELVAIADSSGQRSYDAEWHRLRGEWLVQSPVERSPLGGVERELAAEEAFGQAVEAARTQEAKSFELRAVMALCRLWQRQGRQGEARQRLAEIYGWFVEGFDTADLLAAQALLVELRNPLIFNR